MADFNKHIINKNKYYNWDIEEYQIEQIIMLESMKELDIDNNIPTTTLTNRSDIPVSKDVLSLVCKYLTLLDIVALSKVSFTAYTICSTFVNHLPLHKYSKINYSNKQYLDFLTAFPYCKELSLKNCSNFRSFDCISSYVRKLSLSNLSKVDDNVIFTLVYNVPLLQYLDISYCDNVTDDALVELLNLEHLTYLNISYCNLITADGMKYFLNNNKILAILEMKGTKALRNIFDGTFVKNSSLRTINISECKNIGGVVNISAFSNLQCLTIGKNTQINELIINLPTLESLNLNECTNLYLLNLNTENLISFSLSTTPLLEHIVFPSKSFVLQRFDINSCRSLEINDLLALILNSSSSLRILNISGVVQFTDSKIYTISEVCKHLKQFSINCCKNISQDLVEKMKNIADKK